MIKQLTSINKLKTVVTFLLIITTLVVYYRVGTFDFITFDDNIYVYEELHVKEGLSFQNVLWCLKHPHANNWHPITSISLFLNSSLFGMNPGSYHFVNLAFHLANSLLLLLVLTLMTGNYWRSIFVAALFALHPLHVESVAWVSERKDVLSAFFWILTMLSYWWYASCPRIGRYILVVLFLVLGLLAKPMLVTLPFVLLLLDYWPLSRINPNKLSQAKFLILEKLPLFVSVTIFSVVTFFVQNNSHMVKSTMAFPLNARIANAIVSYMAYLRDMLCPLYLSIFYPFPDNIPILQTVLAGFLLLSITLLALWFLKKFPYFAVGWFWYLGTLIPVIGIIQVGLQAKADRYTYIPLIGIFIIFAWGIPEILTNVRYKLKIIATVASVLLIICAVSTWFQISYWKNSKDLYTHAIKAIDDNYWAYNQLAHILLKEGHADEAIKYYQTVLKVKPNYTTDALYNIGVAFLSIGKIDEAIKHLKIWLHDNPYHANAHFIIGIALLKQNHVDEAINQFSVARKLNPQDEQTKVLLQNTLLIKTKMEAKIRILEDQLVKNTRNLDVMYKLANLYLSIGQSDKAISYLNRALSIKPENPDVYYNLACIYSRQNNVDESVNNLQQAVQKGFHNWELIRRDPDLANIRNTAFINELMKYN